jgi:integrase
VVFKYAEKHTYISKSPCVDTLKVVDVKRKEAEHIDNSFSIAEVGRMIGQADGLLQGGTLDNSTKWKAYIPLILCYTGARLNEICAMDGESVRQDSESGLWFFNIRDDEKRKLKVKGSGSRRMVPLHPELSG